MIRPIAISLVPNFEIDDYKLTFKLLLNPKIWKNGAEQNKLKNWFKNYFNCKNVYLFNSGRTALFALLKSYGIGKGDEVIIQGFTCVAVPNSVIWTDAKPVFADIDQSLNINPAKLENYISKKTKAIIVQHTLGVPANIKVIKKIALKHKILIIEDCAHSLGAYFENQKLGTYGDAAFFSFGRDKVVSSVFGGVALINNANQIVLNKIVKLFTGFPDMSSKWILKQILYPLFFLIILPFYNLLIGKIILHLLIKFGLIDKPVEDCELNSDIPSFFPGKFSNALSIMALNQLKKLDRYNSRRRQISSIYLEKLKSFNFIKLPLKINGSIYLRFNIRLNDNKELLNFFKANSILVGNWYSNIIDPKGVNFSKIGYKQKSLPIAELASHQSLNLPTYPLLTDKEVNLIIRLIKDYGSKRNKQ